jgi:hypothetical protein
MAWGHRRGAGDGIEPALRAWESPCFVAWLARRLATTGRWSSMALGPVARLIGVFWYPRTWIRPCSGWCRRPVYTVVLLNSARSVETHIGLKLP